MNALDAFQTALQLDLVFANLRLHRRHHRAQPDFGIPVGVLEGATHLDCDFLEELLRDVFLVVGHQADHGIQMIIAPGLQAVELLFVAQQRKTGRRTELQTMLDRKFLVDRLHHGENFANFTTRLGQRLA
ncbi:hypothetical protein SDC9_188321 [bioreactor metagenome]|uniref:Uncharacterized protein n=1 Tax=bioreactor metagenome TaxID=1076179 RepID=A0A645HQR1_9ZZZZ